MLLYSFILVSTLVAGFILHRAVTPSARTRTLHRFWHGIQAWYRGRTTRSVSAARKAVGSLALLFVVTAFTFGTFGRMPSANTVMLPVEVIGPNGTTRSIAVQASDVSNVQALYIRAHSIGYPDHVIQDRGYRVDKASIRINGGSWVNVNNGNATCAQPEESIGCITGPYHTIRFTIPISKFGALRAGSNRIDFRFNYASPDVSTGYRVLDVELRQDNGSDAIDETQFVWDDPATWVPPAEYGNSSDIQAGKDLWHQRNLLVGHWEGGKITASCADCHAGSGRDLQYFAFSNESIVERSRFHGLTENQGKQIAAYIRSVELRKKDGSTYVPPGRPWEPPYQPGPTALATRDESDPRTTGRPFDEIDQQYWAAGAGLDWVFERDAETYSYLFPGGPGYDDVDPEQRKLNMRTLPLALQMPDWNEWLPVHHPLDGFSDFSSPSGTSSGRCKTERQEAWSYYRNQVTDISGSTRPEDVENRLDTFFNKANDYRRCNDPVGSVDAGMASTGLIQWTAVKTWETLHTHSLENLGPQLYPEGEPLSWPGQARVLFNIAPHIIKYPNEGSEQPKGDRTKVTDVYYDTAWYQHQMTLNAGHNYYTGLKPVDWKYHFQHVRWYDGVSHRPQSVRYIASYLKLLQTAELAPADARPNEPEGWYLRHLTPAWLLDKEESDVTQHHLEALNDVTLNGRCHMTEELTRLFVRGVTEEPMSEWLRQEGREGLEPSSFTPTVYPDPLIFDNTTYANHIYRAIPLLGQIGVSSQVLNQLATWADNAWPNASPSFAERVVADASCGAAEDPPEDPTEVPSTPFTATITSPSSERVILAPGSLTITADVSVPAERSVSNVTFRADGDVIGEDASDPYSFTWTNIPEGTYRLTVQATDDQGTTAVSSETTVEVIALEAGAVWYEYYEGTWSELPDFDRLTPVLTGITTGFDLGVRERDDRFVIRFRGSLTAPETGTYTFYTSSDDGSKLWIDDSLVVDNDGLHPLQERQGQIELSRGEHRVTVAFLEAEGGEKLLTHWAGPGFTKEPIPTDRLTPTHAQTVDLAPGWNLVSTHIDPAVTELDSLLGDARDEIVLVKDEAGNTYVPGYDINTIGSWKPLEAYMIYASEAKEIVFKGMPVGTANAALQLDTGWNMVSYLPPSSMPVEEAFASIRDVLVMVKNFAGEVYIPEYRINNIGRVQPGQGYKVYVTQNVTLTYPSDSKMATANATSAKTTASGSSRGGVYSSDVLLLDAPTLRDGSSVSVWTADRMLSRSTVQNGQALISVPGDAEGTDVQEGARPDEPLTLKHKVGGETTALSATSLRNAFTGESVGGSFRFRGESFFLASVARPSLALQLDQNYPNPFSSSTTIEYTVPEKQSVRIEVFDVLGRRVKTLVNDVKKAGAHEAKLDARSLSSGVYFYRIKIGGTEQGPTHRMVVVR